MCDTFRIDGLNSAGPEIHDLLTLILVTMIALEETIPRKLASLIRDCILAIRNPNFEQIIDSYQVHDKKIESVFGLAKEIQKT
jgi:hypothetical protein